MSDDGMLVRVTVQDTWEGYDDDLGSELDLFATYKYSPNLTFSLGVGVFWPGEFMEDNFGEDADDDGILVDLKTVVTF